MRLLVATGYPGVCDLDWRSCWLQLFEEFDHPRVCDSDWNVLFFAASLWRIWPSQSLWLRFYTKLFLAAALWQVWKTSWNRQKRASSVFLSLSSNAHACQTRDWRFESPLKKIWHSSTNNVHFKSLHFLHVTFLGSRLCFGPLFQVSVQRFAFLSENKSCRIIGGKVCLWSYCDLSHSHVLPTNEELGN